MKQHDHEWGPINNRQPVLEDRRAIFTVECRYVETLGSTYSEKHDEVFYREGEECDETKQYSFDWEEVICKADSTQGNLGPRRIRNTGRGDSKALERISEVETAEDVRLVEVDPDEDSGRVVAETDETKVIYTA